MNKKPICNHPVDGCMTTGEGFRLCCNPEHRQDPSYATLGPFWHAIPEWSYGTCGSHRTPHPKNNGCKNWNPLL